MCYYRFLPLAALVGITVCGICVAGEQQTLTLRHKRKEGRFHQNSPPQSIIGGEEIKPHSRPYLVTVGTGPSDSRGHSCGGSLISPHAVLTAAHCVGGFYWHPPEWVEFNRHDLLNDTGVTRIYLNNTSQCDGDVIYHPDYNDFTSGYDVAILFLGTAVNDIMPVTLNTDPNSPAAGDSLDVAGWGVTEYGVPSVPSAVTLTYLTNEACTKKPYRYKDEEITDSMMCAYAYQKDSCWGDSG